MPDDTTVLEAIGALSGQMAKIDTKIDEKVAGLSAQIAAVSSKANQSFNLASEAHTIATVTREQVGSLPPGKDELNGAAPLPPIVKRVSQQEGTLTEVVAQLADVKATLAKQNKTAGIADEAASLASKFYTFAMSREGVNFAIRLATLAAVGYFAFQQYLVQKSGGVMVVVPTPPALTSAPRPAP